MTLKTEYFVVVRKVGESEGREVGAFIKRRIVRVPEEFAYRGLALLMPEKIAQAMANKIKQIDDVDQVKVERISPNSPPPPKEADV